MYCPQCGTNLADTAARCYQCDLDVRPIARMLRSGDRPGAGEPMPPEASARARRWQVQRHALGLLLIMCSLLVGCFIPISIGLFNGAIALGSLILVLAGLAGVLLLLGTMLILAAEGQILTSASARGDDERSWARGASLASPSTPLLGEDSSAPPARDERSSRSVSREA